MKKGGNAPQASQATTTTKKPTLVKKPEIPKKTIKAKVRVPDELLIVNYSLLKEE